MTMTAAPPELPAEPARRRRRWPWAVAGLVVLGGGALAFATTRGDDEPAPPAATSELPDPLAGSNDPDTVELAELLAAGRATTYHATYQAAGTAEVEAGATTFEVWRAGGKLRQDTATTIEGAEVRTASFLTDDELVLCTKSAAADWVCATSEPTGTEEDGLFGSVTAQLAGGSVTARDDEVAGESVRCFAFSGATGEGDVCVTSQGVPASVRVGELSIELATLVDDVAADVFDPPAAPVQADTAG